MYTALTQSTRTVKGEVSVPLLCRSEIQKNSHIQQIIERRIAVYRITHHLWCFQVTRWVLNLETLYQQQASNRVGEWNGRSLSLFAKTLACKIKCCRCSMMKNKIQRRVPNPLEGLWLLRCHEQTLKEICLQTQQFGKIQPTSLERAMRFINSAESPATYQHLC